MQKENVFYATGKRKTAIARTWLKPGNGTITVNNKPVDEYFPVPSAKRLLIQPLEMTNTLESYDVNVRVVGGGITGQVSPRGGGGPATGECRSGSCPQSGR